MKSRLPPLPPGRPPTFTRYVPWRPRARPTLEEPVSASALVGEVLARLGGEGRLREFRVFEAFHEAVGAVFRTRTAPESLRGNTLWVRVTSGAVAHELVLLRAAILAKINEQLGQELVADLRTKVGPLTTTAAPPAEPSQPRSGAR